MVVALVDGLGYWNLNMRLGHAPYLRALMNDTANQRPIATCMPSTTVAAMSTFGTGTCPGMTGMTGYTQLNPKTDEICQLISFKNAIPPLELQQQQTIFERLSAQDVRTTGFWTAEIRLSRVDAGGATGTATTFPTMIRENGLQPRHSGKNARSDIFVSEGHR